MKAIVPLSPEQLGGAFAEASSGFHVLGQRGRAVIVEFYYRPEGITWFEEFDFLYCQLQHDDVTFKVIRKATDEERKLF